MPLKSDLVDEALMCCPLPIADTILMIDSAQNLHEERDRIVECFRAIIRTLSVLTLSTQIQFADEQSIAENDVLSDLLNRLRKGRKGLTDGQWISLTRESVRFWKGRASEHPLPEVVDFFFGNKKMNRLVDELLKMRKIETVAHGASGDDDSLEDILGNRRPQLEEMLEYLMPLWKRIHLVVPLVQPIDDEESQRAWSLRGVTQNRGRWRRLDLATGVRAKPSHIVVLDEDNRPIVHIYPMALFQRPTPESIEEFFVFDGRSKQGTRHLSVPNMLEITSEDAWKLLESAFYPDKESFDNPIIEGLEAPFLGLRSFERKQAPLFYGRTRESQDLANRVRQHPFVVLTGPSGVGKSSLLQAGAVPLLTEYATVTIRPGYNPVQQLEDGLRRLWSVEEIDWSNLSAYSSQQGLLIIDQAEELLTVCKDLDERVQFVRQVMKLTEQCPTIRILCSCREDFFGPLAIVQGWETHFFLHVMVVSLPQKSDFWDVLTQPVNHFGYSFESPKMVQRMIDDAGSASSALPLLQFCGLKLWERRDSTRKMLTERSLEDLGGVIGALSKHADGVFESLPAVQQRVCQKLFLRMVTAEGTREVSRRVELEEIAGATGLIDKLIDARLLHSREDLDRTSLVEISHESLIHQWDRLKGWREQYAESGRILGVLKHAVEEWERRGRSKSVLWSGEYLVDIKRLQSADVPLTKSEQAFTNESITWDTHQRRRRQWMVALIVLISTVISGVMYVQYQQAEEARIVAEDSRREAERQSEKALLQTLSAKAKEAELAGKLDEDLAYRRTRVQFGLQNTHDVSFASLQGGDLSGMGTKTLEGHEARVHSASFSSDGKYVVTGSRDKTAKIWEVSSGALVHTLEGHEDSVYTASFSTDGKYVVTGSWDKTAKIWEVSSGTLVHTLEGHERSVRIASFSSDGKYVVTGSRDTTAKIWEVSSGALVHTLEGHEDSVYTASFSSDGKYIVTGSDDDTAKIWEVSSGALFHTLEGHESSVTSASFSSDGKYAVTGSDDDTAKIWEVSSGTLVHTLEGHENGVLSASFSSDGKYVVTGSRDKTAKVWEVSSGRLVHILEGHERYVNSASFSSDDKYVVTSSRDKTAKIWEVSSGRLVHTLEGHEGYVNSASFSSDDKYVVTSSWDKTAKIWEVSSGRLVHTLEGHEGYVNSASFSSDDKYVVTSSWDKTAKIWEVSSGRLVHTLEGHENGVLSASFSSDDKYVVTSSWDKTAKIWEVSSGRLVHTLEGHENGVHSASFSSDDKYVVTSSDDDTAKIWEVSSGRLVHTLEGHENGVHSASFSSDGKYVVTSSWDKTSKIWEVSSGRLVHTLEGHEGYVNSASFSSDGKYVVTSSWDKTAKIWEVSSGRLVHTLEGHENGVNSVSFSSDGKYVVTSSWDKTAKIWEVSSGIVIHTFEGHEGYVNSASFSSDGKYVVTGSYDKTAKIWRMPISDPQELIRITGERTNARVCRDSLEVVNVLPFPDPMIVWAPEELCQPVGD